LVGERLTADATGAIQKEQRHFSRGSKKTEDDRETAIREGFA